MLFREDIQNIITLLAEILKQDILIDEQVYCEKVGAYSKELKILLQSYFESNIETQNLLRPYLNYYQQLQHYLVFLVRNSEILQVPHHSEILQTLTFIENQEELIRDLYIEFSEAQKRLFSGNFRNILDKLLEKKFKELKK